MAEDTSVAERIVPFVNRKATAEVTRRLRPGDAPASEKYYLEACALRRIIRRNSLVVLCDQIERQLEDIRDFFQSCGCSLSPTTFQIGNVTLPDVSVVRDVELRLTAPFAKCA